MMKWILKQLDKLWCLVTWTKFGKELHGCYHREDNFGRDNKGKCANDASIELDDKSGISWNIVRPGWNYQTFHKRWVNFDIKLKYWLLKPMMLIIEKVAGKWLVNEIEDAPHNKNILIFNKAFEKTIPQWRRYYQGYKDFPNEWKDKGIYHYLRFAKKMVVTFFLFDTAYREFINFLMYNITIEMNKGHNTEIVKHLVYTNKIINDSEYYWITGKTIQPVVLEYEGKTIYFKKGLGTVIDKVPDEFIRSTSVKVGEKNV